MNITLPESVRDWVESNARFTNKTPDEFILELVEKAQRQVLDEFLRQRVIARHGPDAEITPERLAEAQRVLEAQLIEGIESGPATPADASFWAERRRILAERIAARQKKVESE